MMHNDTGRCMIIAWEWKYKDDIKDGEAIKWQTNKSNGCDVAYTIRESNSAAARLEIIRIATEFLSKPGNQVFLFFHRKKFSHGFCGSIVDKILEQIVTPANPGVSPVRFFRFDSGDGPIYLRPNSPRGLLGNRGYFYYEEGDQYDARDLESQYTLKSAHFDHTWKMYEYLLKSRIVNLYDKILTRYYNEFVNNDFKEGSLIIEELQRNRNISSEDYRLGFELKSASDDLFESERENYKAQLSEAKYRSSDKAKYEYILFENIQDSIRSLYDERTSHCFRSFFAATHDLLFNQERPKVELYQEFRDSTVTLLRAMPETLSW